MSRFAPVLAALAVSIGLTASFGIAGCGASGGGGGSSGSTSSGVGAATPSSLRLVGFDRRALSPSAAAGLTLVVERPQGAAVQGFSLEESGDGASFTATGQAPKAVLAAALVYELPLPTAMRWYRIAAPAPSNTVALDPASFPLAAANGAQVPALASPAPGSGGVSKRPTISVAGGAGALTFLYAIADEEGTLVWLAESASPSLAPGGAGAKTYIATAGLAASSSHLATAIAIDARGFGAAASAAPRADFTTAP